MTAAVVVFVMMTKCPTGQRLNFSRVVMYLFLWFGLVGLRLYIVNRSGRGVGLRLVGFWLIMTYWLRLMMDWF